MPRFAKTEVAVDVAGYSLVTQNPTILLKDAAGTIHTLSIKGTRFDLDGRIIGKVKGYSKNKRYLVNFGGGFDYYIKTRDCHTPNLHSFPAKQPSPSVAYNLWVDGQLLRGYINAPRRGRRKLGVAEYSARVDMDGKSVYGVAKQDGDGKLYFVPSLRRQDGN